MYTKAKLEPTRIVQTLAIFFSILSCDKNQQPGDADDEQQQNPATKKLDRNEFTVEPVPYAFFCNMSSCINLTE